jgi:putative phage-type endonuclease
MNKVQSIADKINENLKEFVNKTKPVYQTEFQTMLAKRVYNLTLKKYHEQGSSEWLQEREKCISASDAGTALGKNKYEKRSDLILKKCGKGKKFTGNKYTDHGHKYEEIAAQLYQSLNLVPLHFFGLILHSDPSIPIGASPDGIREDGVMLEIKVPMCREIIPNEVPPHYEIQTQVQMEVCDLWENDFYETRIIEYDFRDAYYADSDKKSTRLSRDGCLKGIIGQFYHGKTGKNSYLYPPTWCSSEEMELWLQQMIPGHLQQNPGLCYDTMLYWKQTLESRVRVKRDYKRLHQEYVPEFRKVWEEITQHRKSQGQELGQDAYDSDADIKIEGLTQTPIVGNAFADDSD